MRNRWILLFVLLMMMLLMVSCEKLALMTAAKKKPIASQSELSTLAEKTFWDVLHSGQYQKIPLVDKLLTAAYLQNPNDPSLAAHLGFLHIWKITERNRNKVIEPSIINEIILSKKYFHDAMELNPSDARTQGFYGDTLLVEGKIFKDEREQIDGYFQLKHAIHLWPEFNYFTAGYPMTILDADSDEFKEALDWQWKTLDLCAQAEVNRENPNYQPYMHLYMQTGPKRACWNSWIAPHNFEGFFMNMGDMLVKQGNIPLAIKIYNNAKLSKDYANWPYKNMLEDRIRNANANTKLFRESSNISLTSNQLPNNSTANTMILFNSGVGCVVCHQK